MKKIIPNDSYRIINTVFILIIILIFIYSLVFSEEGIPYPIPSGTIVTGNGEQVISTGLSRSFSSIMRFNFDRARHYNIYGLQIFTFFLVQLALRILMLLLPYNKWQHGKDLLILGDVLVSVILFVVFFSPFIAATFRQLFNLL